LLVGKGTMDLEEVEGVTGAKRAVDGCWRVFYDGYWIKAYDVPADSLRAKKGLIAALTRRLFNHVEHGLNIPGIRLEETRTAFDAETDPGKKRVKGAMLAGALFNRAIDLITKAVELQALGIEIRSGDPLMRLCGDTSRRPSRSAAWSFTAAAKRGSTSSGASRSKRSPSRSRTSTAAAT
jgi:hypothetical protein